MTREDFIKLMQSKGMNLTTYNNVGTYLSRGVETIYINNDNSLICSSPAGNFKYRTFYDFIHGKPYWSETYNITD